MKNLILVLLIFIFNFSTHAQSTLQDSLVAFYDFTGNALDSTGKSSQGTVYGATLTTDRFGRLFHAYDFNGVDSRIEFTEDFDLPERTINVWFYARNINAVAGVIYNSDHPNIQNGLTAMNVVQSNSLNELIFSNGSGPYAYSVLENTWLMATFVKNSNHTFYYINGVLLDSLSNSNVNSLDGVVGSRIGCSRNRDRYFDGVIDDLRIYNRALSSSEVAQLYNFQPVSIENDLVQPLKIFPNPTNSILNVILDSNTNNGNVSYSILDSFGRTHKNGFINDRLEQINVADMAGGVYFIRIDNEDNTLIKKLTIQ
jgi:hypothetical protein